MLTSIVSRSIFCVSRYMKSEMKSEVEMISEINGVQLRARR